MGIESKSIIGTFAVADLSSGWVHSWHNKIEFARTALAKHPSSFCIVEVDIETYRAWLDIEWAPTYESTRCVEGGFRKAIADENKKPKRFTYWRAHSL